MSSVIIKQVRSFMPALDKPDRLTYESMLISVPDDLYVPSEKRGAII